MDFRPIEPVEANERRAFVRHRNADSPARILHAYGRGAGPGQAPRVSILIPTADGDRFGYLPQLLKQIEEQQFQQIEVFVVQGDSRQGRAINTAAALAEGEFLLTFDDDTRLGTPDLIGRLVEVMDADAEIGIAGVSNQVPADASWLVRRIMTEVPRRSSPSVDEVTDSDMAEHPCLAMRRDVFYRVGGEHEVVPRGLDPYLRREFRRAGYRVVVVPGVWIHHLPPPSMFKALRQFFRNGKMSVLVGRAFPELALDNALGHGKAELRAHPLALRAVRHMGRMLQAMIRLRWVYLATSIAYGLGAITGALSPVPDVPDQRATGRSL